jgi:phosphoribosylglycinamide formyltransferase-1
MGIAVLASGEGTILEAILGASIEVAVVATDRPCKAVAIAEDAGIEAIMVDRRDFGGFGPAFERQGYTDALVAALRARRIELVAMAGFGTVLAASFFPSFGGRVLNTHPALLPAFRGWHAVRDALDAGATSTGCTVHLATEQLDDGPILRQVRVEIEPGDDEPRLHERIKAVERQLYPEAIRAVLAALSRGEEPSSIATPMQGASR